MKLSFKHKIIFLGLAFMAAVALGLMKGSVDLPLGKLLSAEYRPILMLRFLRIVMAMIVGSGLAVSGIALQAVLRNPLADPYLLGTSSGAGLGAVIAIVMGAGQYFLPASAFIGAIVCVVLVYMIARQGERTPAQSMILSGVIVSIALSGIIVFIVSSSTDEALRGLMWWIWGSLDIYDVKLVSLVSAIVISGTAAIYAFAQDLNAMSIGEEEAKHLGIDTEAVKKILFLATALITASLVCVSGIIGFVGLVIPHMMRFVVGPNHRVLIPASCLGGAILMIVSDTIGRTAASPLEIPIGVVTAVIGAPVFIILLKTRQKVI